MICEEYETTIKIVKILFSSFVSLIRWKYLNIESNLALNLQAL